jgi:hypothetical protein
VAVVFEEVRRSPLGALPQAVCLLVVKAVLSSTISRQDFLRATGLCQILISQPSFQFCEGGSKAIGI